MNLIEGGKVVTVDGALTAGGSGKPMKSLGFPFGCVINFHPDQGEGGCYGWRVRFDRRKKKKGQNFPHDDLYYTVGRSFGRNNKVHRSRPDIARYVLKKGVTDAKIAGWKMNEENGGARLPIRCLRPWLLSYTSSKKTLDPRSFLSGGGGGGSSGGSSSSGGGSGSGGSSSNGGSGGGGSGSGKKKKKKKKNKKSNKKEKRRRRRSSSRPP